MVCAVATSHLCLSKFNLLKLNINFKNADFFSVAPAVFPVQDGYMWLAATVWDSMDYRGLLPIAGAELSASALAC